MAALLTGALIALAAATLRCEPAQVTAEMDALPEPWRHALEELVEATGREGRPWSCTGARIMLSLEGNPLGPAWLVVEEADGARLERLIERPEDLVPQGEALLAQPLRRAASAELPSLHRSPSPPHEPLSRSSPGASTAAPAPPVKEHRSSSTVLRVDGAGSVRYSGPLGAIWMGGMLAGTIPLDAWIMGVWARFDVGVVELRPVPVDFTMTSWSVGMSIGRSLLTSSSVELDVALEPSIAIISMDDGPDLDELQVSAKADARLGTRIQVALPFGARWRGLAALSGELSPLSMLSPRHREFLPEFPPLPIFMLGASLGLELTIR